MALRSSKPAHTSASSISSLDSVSSEETPTRLTAYPRRATLLRNSIESRLSYEYQRIDHPDGTQPVQALVSPGSGLDEERNKERPRERASFSKYYPRIEPSRSAWPSSSTRDLLKEAGEWLDAQYPGPNIQIPNTGMNPAYSPRSEDFSPSPLVGSRPTTSSTSRDEVLDASEKIVYIPREAKLRALMENMQRDVDQGTEIQRNRKERVRSLLKEIQDKDEERAAQAKSFPEDVAELDTIETEREPRNPMTADDSAERNAHSSNNFHESTDEAQAVHDLTSEQNLQQSLQQTQLCIDLPTQSDQQLSVAIAQALSFSQLPELEQSDTNVPVEPEESPAEALKMEIQHIEPASCYSPPDQTSHVLHKAEITPALAQEPNGDKTILDAQAQTPISESMASERSPVSERSTQTEFSLDDQPAMRLSISQSLPESPTKTPSVFSDLDDLVGAFRPHRRLQP